MGMLAQELKEVSNIVGKIIREDAFFGGISPEFLREAVVQYPFSDGKKLRPAIVMWVCGMLGGDLKKVGHVAASVEIYHNWTLTHDDIIDRDDMRRGSPSCHKKLEAHALKALSLPADRAAKFGNDFAILAGDAQHAWSMHMMIQAASDGVEPKIVMELLSRMQMFVNRAIISGQGQDMSFPFREYDMLVYEEIENMMNLKTGSLLGFCAEAGAAVAFNSTNFLDRRIVELFRMAVIAGLAFQLKDDWLGVFGDEKKFGKPAFSDFAESKPTAMLVAALDRLEKPDRVELMGMLGRESYDEEAIEKARGLVRKSGADKFILDKAAYYIQTAKEILHIFDDNKYRTLLMELLEFMVEREK